MKKASIIIFIIDITTLTCILAYMYEVKHFSTTYNDCLYHDSTYAKGMGLEKIPCTYDELIFRKGKPLSITNYSITDVHGSFDCVYSDCIYTLIVTDEQELKENSYRVMGFSTTSTEIKFGVVSNGLHRMIIKLLYWKNPTITVSDGDLCYIDGFSVYIRFHFAANNTVDKITIGMRE